MYDHPPAFRCASVISTFVVVNLSVDAFWHCKLVFLTLCLDHKHFMPLGVILFRIFIIWDRSAKLRHFLLLGAAIAYMTSIIFVVLFCKDAQGTKSLPAAKQRDKLLFLDKTVYYNVSFLKAYVIRTSPRRFSGVQLPQVSDDSTSIT